MTLDLTARIASALSFSPHDFVPGISLAEDRLLHVEGMTRPLASENDLRSIHHTPDGELAVLAERLSWDSNFFGCEIARLHGVFPLGPGLLLDDGPIVAALKSLTARAQERGVRYLFASVDARDVPLCRALGAAGFSLIETRVVYHRTVSDQQPSERHAWRMATAADVESLSAAAVAAVNPFDRFRADPFFPSADVDRLLARWMEASILHGFADATIVPDEPNPRAFCTLKYHRDRSNRWRRRIGQIVLVARDPQAAGKGQAARLMSEIVHHLHQEQFDHLMVITQLANRPMVKNCERLGFRVGRGEQTFRIVLPAPDRPA